MTTSLLAVMVLAAGTEPKLTACRLFGVETDAQCGSVSRPLDPAKPDGTRIDVKFAVLPSAAREKAGPPVFFFAGGPGQSALAYAGELSKAFERLNRRRDLVLVDQRGTGSSAPLTCPELSPLRPLREQLDSDAEDVRVNECLDALKKLPHGDLRFYTTSIAMGDFDAVREVLKAPQIELIGVSYGTRAALEYMRLYPTRVHRVILDGVAPPDMSLPDVMDCDFAAELHKMFDACANDARCEARYPQLEQRWGAWVRTLPLTTTVRHPLTHATETVSIDRRVVEALLRGPLYASTMRAFMPFSMHAAISGDLAPLLSTSPAFTNRREDQRLALGMHLSVICSEDFTHLTAPERDDPWAVSHVYLRMCPKWPRGTVDDAFYRVGTAPGPTLLLSGGDDPATPPAFGERTASALGARARHVVFAHSGHGALTGLACVRDAVSKFFDDEEAEALKVNFDCAAKVPALPAFVPFGGRP